MIAVTIVKAIYIRKGPGTGFNYLGIIYPSGNVLQMAGTVQGESNKGISTWYYLVNDSGVKQYYWGGGISEIETPAAPPAPPAPAPTPGLPPVLPPAQPVTDTGLPTFPWFEALQVEQLWNSYHAKGANVTVAVLDTGYNVNNAEVAAAVKASKLFTGDDPDNGINDLEGHGTHCTSIIAARNLQNYKIGIAPACSIISGKISLFGEACATDTMLDAIRWATGAGADIISISFSADVTDPAAISAFQTQLSAIIAGKNILVFAASGDNFSAGTVTKEIYPASLNGCISVGASDKDAIAQITIRSNKTTMHAQGVDVAAYKLQAQPELSSGTSVSAPIVAGVAALAVSYLKGKNGSWNAADLLQKIYDTGTPIAGAPGKKIINPAGLFLRL